MKYINHTGERTDVPKDYYEEYTEAEWKKEYPDGLNENCSCGSDVHYKLRDNGMECRCACHDNNIVWSVKQ